MVLALLGGTAVGLLIGMLGGGGAILSIPLLVYGFSFPAHQATAASLVTVLIGALSAAITHQRQRNIRLKEGIIFGLLGTGGSFLAHSLSTGIDEHLLLSLFSVLLLVVATLMFRNTLHPRRTPHPQRASPPKTRLLPLITTATAAGFLTGFFGVGGGFAIVPALTLVLGFSINTAIGTSLVVITINSLVALGMRTQELSHLNWEILTAFILTVLIGATAGSYLMNRVKKSALQLGFASFLLAICLFMGIQNIPHLIS